MATFANTKSTIYTKQRVRTLNAKRLTAMPPSGDVSKVDDYRKKLGKLLAAGHLKINGFRKMETQREPHFLDVGNIITRQMQFETHIHHKNGGEPPHLTGYLESGNQIDSKYKIKGWFNEDGTIRIELVN
jgi:hypothetical protein